jgi:hypothetical protein
VPRLLEEEFLQLRRLGIADMAQSEVAGYRFLMFGDCGLPFAVELQQTRIESQLRCAEAHQFIDDLKWLLSVEAIEQSHKGDLEGKAEPVVRAPALTDLHQVFTGESRAACLSCWRENICSGTVMTINYNL